jgi:hypothetical protein
MLCVDRVGRSELLGHLQLVIYDIDGHDGAPCDLRVLEGEMAQAADAVHGHQVGGAGARDLDRLVGRHPRTGERSRVEWVDALGHAAHERCVGDDVVSEATVDRVTGVPLVRAEGLPPARAPFARAARPAEPRRRHSVPDRDAIDARRHLCDDADPFVARHERR